MNKKEDQPIQFLAPHRVGCHCISDFDNPWLLPEYKGNNEAGAIRRDPTGRNNAKAGHSWIVFHCNDSECKARLVVFYGHLIHVLDLRSDKWKVAING